MKGNTPFKIYPLDQKGPNSRLVYNEVRQQAPNPDISSAPPYLMRMLQPTDEELTEGGKFSRQSYGTRQPTAWCEQPKKQRPVHVNEVKLEPDPVNAHVQYQSPENNTPDSYMLLACLVCWLCNPPFGIVALYFSIMSNRSSAHFEWVEARRSGRYSMVISVAGIIVTIFILIVVVPIIAVLARRPDIMSH